MPRLHRFAHDVYLQNLLSVAGDLAVSGPPVNPRPPVSPQGADEVEKRGRRKKGGGGGGVQAFVLGFWVGGFRVWFRLLGLGLGV